MAIQPSTNSLPPEDRAEQEHPVITDATGVKRRNGRFAPGSARPNGAGWSATNRQRVAQNRAYIEELCSKEGLPFNNLVALLAHVALTGRDYLEKKVNNAYGVRSPYHLDKLLVDDGEGNLVPSGYVSLESRLECAHRALPYLHPKINSIEITGADGSPLFDQEREAAVEMSKDPDVRTLMEKIAIKQAAMMKEETQENED